MDPILRYTKLDEIADKQELIYDKYNKRWNEIRP